MAVSSVGFQEVTDTYLVICLLCNLFSGISTRYSTHSVWLSSHRNHWKFSCHRYQWTTLYFLYVLYCGYIIFQINKNLNIRGMPHNSGARRNPWSLPYPHVTCLSGTLHTVDHPLAWNSFPFELPASGTPHQPSSSISCQTWDCAEFFTATPSLNAGVPQTSSGHSSLMHLYSLQGSHPVHGFQYHLTYNRNIYAVPDLSIKHQASNIQLKPWHLRLDLSYWHLKTKQVENTTINHPPLNLSKSPLTSFII